MSKKVKELMQAEFKARFENVSEFAIVSVRGVEGTDNNQLRGDLKEKGIELHVVKNSLAAKAFAELGRDGIKELLVGPCAITYGGDSIVDVAKLLVDAAKGVEALELKGAYLDGEVLDAEGAKALAKMPSRAELQGTVVLIANSPGARLAGAIGGPAGYIAGCVKSLVEKLETGEAA